MRLLFGSDGQRLWERAAEEGRGDLFLCRLVPFSIGHSRARMSQKVLSVISFPNVLPLPLDEV